MQAYNWLHAALRLPACSLTRLSSRGVIAVKCHSRHSRVHAPLCALLYCAHTYIHIKVAYTHLRNCVPLSQALVFVCWFFWFSLLPLLLSLSLLQIDWVLFAAAAINCYCYRKTSLPYHYHQHQYQQCFGTHIMYVLYSAHWRIQIDF